MAATVESKEKAAKPNRLIVSDSGLRLGVLMQPCLWRMSDKPILASPRFRVPQPVVLIALSLVDPTAAEQPVEGI
jgi:hypothetical protein